MGDKENLRLSQREAEMVLSSLGYRNTTGKNKEWRGPAKCHGGDNKHGFSFHYDRGTAVCWTGRCFGEGTDIFGVVELELGINFFYAKRHVEEIIGRKLEDSFDQERSNDYQEYLMRLIKETKKEADKPEQKSTRFISDQLWEIYAKNRHPYWADRGISGETLEYFGCGYNPENNRITIPIFDHDGKFIAMKERIASDDKSLITDTNPKYLHDSFNAGSVLFNLDNVINILSTPYLLDLLEFKGIILVEGHLDVIMAYQLGFPNVVATGSNTLTKEQARLLERYTTQVLIIPDEDEKIEKGKKVWHGGSLIESAKRELGLTTTLFVSRLKPIKDIGQLVGEYGGEYLTCTVRNRVLL